MQYLGGKSRIAEEILNGIESRFEETTNFIDLFSGSGVIAYRALLRGYNVTANDIQPYSAVFLSSLLTNDISGINSLIQTLSDTTVEDLFVGSRSNYLQDYEIEKQFFINSSKLELKWQSYQKFCDETNLTIGQQDEIEALKSAEKWTLFLAYYRNTYFGVRQCAEIDYLRELSESLSSPLREHLIASVISVMTHCVSSTTHLAQFLKPTTEKNTLNLIKKREVNVVLQTILKLKTIIETAPKKSAEVINLDFIDALEEINLDSSYVIYADPPYFKEHYSRYYHVLDTFALYDYPLLTYNKRMESTTIGRYREDRIVSDFGKKSLVRSAFEKLIATCRNYGNKLAISYACSSLVEKQFFYDYAEKNNLKLTVLEFDLVHTGQGQARHKKVKEFLFLYSYE